MIRTAIVAIFLALVALIAGPLLLLFTFITRNPGPIYWVGTRAVFFVAWLVGVRVKVEGREKVPPRPVLFLANHTSYVDAAPIVRALPRRVAILAKKSLFQIPVIGSAFHSAGFVPVDRQNRETAIESVNRAAEYLKSGTSFLAFPEGTRSFDGRLLPFKKGVFVMAIKAGATIVPVAASGVHTILPKKSMRIRPGRVVVRFGDPIDSSTYTVDQRDKLSDRVRSEMIALLSPEQQPLDATSPAEPPAAATASPRPNLPR
jgi:1-acyl-sn-glycerol-3-phosphate acyltransferase